LGEQHPQDAASPPRPPLNHAFLPVAPTENACAIATGAGFLNAFDRMEVTLFSACAVIAGREIGVMVMIGDDRIAEIDRALNL
jgi:hypothetical protein